MYINENLCNLTRQFTYKPKSLKYRKKTTCNVKEELYKWLCLPWPK